MDVVFFPCFALLLPMPIAYCRKQAPEVTCDADGRVKGATLSDHGYVILTLFPLQSEAEAPAQQQAEFGDECERRKESGYNSGMGEIFREVAGIFPLR